MRYCKVCKLFCNVSGLLIRYRCYRLLLNRSYACNFYNVFYSKCSSSKLEVSLLSACQRVFTKLELTTQFLQLGSHLHQDTCLNRIQLKTEFYPNLRMFKPCVEMLCEMFLYGLM